MSELQTMERNVEADEFLQHFGVKGMKWGHHSAEGGGASGGGSRTERKIAKVQAKVEKKVEKQKASDERDKTILTARENLSKSHSDLQTAKQQYKIEKLTKGKAAAKESLNKVKDVHITNITNANLATAKEIANARNTALWGPEIASIMDARR